MEEPGSIKPRVPRKALARLAILRRKLDLCLPDFRRLAITADELRELNCIRQSLAVHFREVLATPEVRREMAGALFALRKRIRKSHAKP
ncbi:MAG: hypothetical protein V1790_17665 [Planctomycetota bacterium]